MKTAPKAPLPKSPDIPSSDLGQRVDALRRERRWTLAELARRVAAAGAPTVKRQHIEALVATRGRRVAWVIELAAAFEMSVEQLVNGTSAEPNTDTAAYGLGEVVADAVGIPPLTAAGPAGVALPHSFVRRLLPTSLATLRVHECTDVIPSEHLSRGAILVVDAALSAWGGSGLYVLEVGGHFIVRRLHMQASGDLRAMGPSDSEPSENVPGALIRGRILGVLDTR